VASKVQPGKPTITDVARRAGVSKSLVSLVMRGADHVSPERRQAVNKAAAELGYRPNAMARSLVQRRTHLVGVMVSDLHNPFFADVVAGIQEQAERTERIQRKAELLQDRGASLVGGARKVVVVILPVIVLLLVYLSWLLFRSRF